MAKNINQIKIDWQRKQHAFRLRIRKEATGKLGYAKKMIFLNQILSECEPKLEQIRIADDYASGRGRIEKQGYSALPSENKKYQFKYGFAHKVAGFENDDLATQNSPEWAAMKEQEKIAEVQRVEK